jgi:hypothetical protein
MDNFFQSAMQQNRTHPVISTSSVTASATGVALFVGSMSQRMFSSLFVPFCLPVVDAKPAEEPKQLSTRMAMRRYHHPPPRRMPQV